MFLGKSQQQHSVNSVIHLLIFLIMAVPLSSALNLSSADPRLKETFLRRLPLDNVLFTEDVLLEVSARSQIDCSKKCVETEGCVMCTFLSSPQGPPGHCRLHSQLQSSTDTKKTASGASSFALPAPAMLSCTESCDDGYTQACGRRLRSVTSQLTSRAAQDRCRALGGGQLVMPKTPTDLACVKTFIDSQSGQYYSWVGADDRKTSGSFLWNDGTPLPASSGLWEGGILGGNLLPQCVRMEVSPNSKLRHINCDSTYTFVCQKSLV